MASPNISFSELSEDIVIPGVYGEHNLSTAKAALPGNAQKVLIIGQRLRTPSDWADTTAYALGERVKPTAANGHWYICVAAGTSGAAEPTWPTAAAGTVVDGTATWMEWVPSGNLVAEKLPTKIYSASEAAAYAGEGSQVHLMAAAALDRYRQLDLTIATLEDESAAVVAAGSLALTGTATSVGTLTMRIADVRIAVAVTLGETAAALATAAVAAVNAKKHLLPLTAALDTATMRLYSKHGGTIGNYIPLEYTLTARGITVVLTDMASGATDPDIGASSGLLDAVLPGDYSIYCCGWVDAANLGDLKSHIDEVSGPAEQRGAIAVIGYTDEVGNTAAVKTLCGSGASPTLNNWRILCANITGTRSLYYELAGATAAALATTAPRTPIRDLVLDNIHVPPGADRYTRSVLDDLLRAGVAACTVVSEAVVLLRGVTTYTTNPQGVADTTRRDIAQPRIMDRARTAIRSRLSLRFSASHNTVATRKSMWSESWDVLKALEAEGDLRDLDTYKDYLIVEEDESDNTRANIRVPVPTSYGLMVIGVRTDML